MSAETLGASTGRTTSLALVLGPALYAAGTVIFFAREQIIGAGLDLAKVQGLVGVPLLVLGPAVLALAWLPGGAARVARLVAGAVALAIAAGETLVVALSVTQIGCQPVSPPFGGLGQALVLGLAAGVSFAASVTLAAGAASGGRPRAALVIGSATAAATYALQLGLLVVLFVPGVSCASVP